VPTGIPGSGRGAKTNGKRPRRKVKRRKPEESFIAPELSRFETQVLYKRLSRLPRAGVGVREGAALSSIIAKMTEAVITRP
jgi:hypothetical protein